MKVVSSLNLDAKAPVVVVSDVHLGSPHCRRTEFLQLLDSFQAPVTLVFAGDTFDRPAESFLTEADHTVLERLSNHAYITPVFVCGNHDENGSWYDKTPFPLAREVNIPSLNMCICHGDSFQINRGHHRLFVFAFKHLHRLRVSLGAPPVHVAQYAKHWSFFYRVLRRIVRENAVDYARQQGFKVIACGHVHFAEDSFIKGIRYLNTGCWTEPDPHYLSIENNDVKLKIWSHNKGKSRVSVTTVG
jgi:UDP-2,3-diacylglucosamine pyrophosphatase LpxH